MSDTHILVVDDEPDICTLVQEILQDEGYQVSTAKDAAMARASKREQRPDLILLDIWMPDVDGISLLKEWSDSASLDAPVIMMSGHGTVETAVEATRLGAYDFIEKPLSMTRLLQTVKQALEQSGRPRPAPAETVRELHPRLEFLGKSAPIQQLLETARRVAAHDSPVLISGESGSGRSVLARFIHQHSTRHDMPYTEVPADDLPRVSRWRMEEHQIRPLERLDLSEESSQAELLSTVLSQAAGGTVCISRATELAGDAQNVLANFLQHPQGAPLEQRSHTRAANAPPRVIACVDETLNHALASGRFREDLYYLLNVFPLELPPLRDHVDDIQELVEHFVDRLVTEHDLAYRRVTVSAQNRLRNHTWPGNVRELLNLTRRLLVLGDSVDISAEEIDALLDRAPDNAADPNAIPGIDLPLKDAREIFERRYLIEQIRREGGNISRVAQRAGLERTHLYRKLKTLNVDPKQVLD